MRPKWMKDLIFELRKTYHIEDKQWGSEPSFDELATLIDKHYAAESKPSSGAADPKTFAPACLPVVESTAPAPAANPPKSAGV
jgi:hypothetical protein